MLGTLFKTISLLNLLLVFTFYSHAQYYSAGQDPASQRWRQINTSSFKLIYPETWENKAHKLAGFLEIIKEPVSNSLDSKPSEIPVILHNQSVLSNGFAVWAPKRIEMITTIPDDNIATDWMKHLAIHEYRHIAQIEGLNKSTTGFLSKLFGQHILGAVVGLHLPLWFLEGDAVLVETAMTNSGRGRISDFISPLTTQLLEKGAYSYDKAIMGSYRDMVPDHYTLGYHMVAMTHNQFGFEPFLKSMKNIARLPIIPGSFSRGLKETTGMNSSGLYRHTVSKLKKEWTEQNRNFTISEFRRIEAGSDFDYAEYINPHYVDDSTYIAFRTAPGDIPRLVLIDRHGSEKIIFTPGFGFYDFLCFAEDIAVWAEITIDPRWEYRNWSNIRIFDITTGESRLITQKARLQSPVLSPDASKIAAIEVDEQNEWALTIIDTKTGEEIQRINDPEIDFLLEPEWSHCSECIIAVAFNEGSGKTIVKTNIQQPRFQGLFHAGFTEISKPAFADDSLIYFTGTWSGRDEIYAWNTEEKQLYHILAAEYGATNIVLSDDETRFLFSEFTAEGYKIAECTNIKKTPVEIKDIRNNLLPLYSSATRSFQMITDTIAATDTLFRSMPFIKRQNRMNFHSWLPAFLDVEDMTLKPGVSAFSQNYLGTAISAIRYEYDPKDKRHEVSYDLSLQSSYPAFDLGFGIGSENPAKKEDSKSNYAFMNISASLPLAFNHNAIIYGILPQISNHNTFLLSHKFLARLSPVSYSLSLYAHKRMAMRDLYPQFGISTVAGFSHTPFNHSKYFTDIDAGDIAYGAATVFLPGLLKHHSLRLYAGIQKKTNIHAYFNDKIRFARGYDDVPLNNEMLTLSASYSFPFAYPDFALGSVIYVKRLRANMFTDHSRTVFDLPEHSTVSVGFDIIADAHLLRLPMPFEFGLRTVYLQDLDKIAFQFLFGVDFYAIGNAFRKGRVLPPKY